MADDKKTQLGTGTGALARPTGSQGAQVGFTPLPVDLRGTPTTLTPAPITGAPAGTGAPVTAGEDRLQTSYLPGNDVDPMIGKALAGRYMIEKKLGEGGMGAVYLASHQILEKKVALKVLHGEFARKPDLVERFMQEAKAASRIRHENVIDISDFGQTPEGMVFFAMELLKGHDLHEEVARARLAGQLLPWARTKPIFLQICSALTAAHGHGIVHRDLKPENIYLVEFLGEPDFVKLLDFGIAKLTEVAEGDRKLTRTGMLFGTPEYMSPEQARGDQVDHRVDVYAMGCILFQLVTGRVPFEADNFMGVLSLHLTEPPPSIPPEVFDHIGAPREIAGVIDKALAKDRDQRFQTIADMANAIRVACGEAPVIAGERKGTPAPRVASVAAPATTTTQRQKTKWTGKLSVPEVEATAPTMAPGAGGSRVGLYLGIAAVVIAGGGVAAFFATRAHGGDTAVIAPATPGSGSGSAGIVAVQPPVTPAVPPPVTVTPPPPVPEQVKIELDSSPHGAEVVDLKSNHPIGHTPMKFNLHGSRDVRQYALHLKGYGDSIVELTPDHDTQFVATLEKGANGAAPVVQHVPQKPTSNTASIQVKMPDLGPRPPETHGAGSGATTAVVAPGVPTTTPEVTPTKAPETKDTKPVDTTPEVKPVPTKPDEPDDGLPHIKTNIPGLQGSGT